MSKSNESWNDLCALTTQLAPRFGGSRGDAFQAACDQRPDLAASAISPDGEWVIARPRGSKPAASASAGSLLIQAAERIAEAHKQGSHEGGGNALIAAAEQMAAKHRAESRP